MTATRTRIGLFALLTVASVIVAGIRYVGIPERYLGQSTTISVNLPESGGIFPNAEVTLRGVQVGRVQSLHLTADGVRADLRIDKGLRIPSDTLVKVANLSAVGEQYIDLRPRTSRGPYLRAGQALPVSAATVPIAVTELLVELDRLATSIGKPELHTMVVELGQAFTGSAKDLGTVLDQTMRLTDALTHAQPATTDLLRDSEHVLDTQIDLRTALRQFSDALDQLTTTVVRADPDLRRFLTDAPGTIASVAGFLRTTDTSVGVLLGNLLSVSEIAAAPVRLNGQNNLLVILPLIIQGTFNIQPGDGYTRLGLVLTTDQAVCTEGYQSSGRPPVQQKHPSDPAGDPDLRANLNAFCASPPSTGIDVRGAANASRPPGDTTARPVPVANPRGFGPGSSFTNDPMTSVPTPSADSTAPHERTAPTPVRVLGPTDLSGLILKDLR